MPREVIHSSNPDHQPFRISVGWTKDLNAQIGIQVEDPDRTLADIMFAGHVEALGKAVEGWLVDIGHFPEAPTHATSEVERSAHEGYGRLVLCWLAGVRDYVERDGVWVDMARSQLNDLVRHSRTARDGAYGKDQ